MLKHVKRPGTYLVSKLPEVGTQWCLYTNLISILWREATSLVLLCLRADAALHETSLSLQKHNLFWKCLFVMEEAIRVERKLLLVL